MQVLYRFRSEEKFTSLEMERSSIPLWELRAEIISQRHLTLHDYHLIFYLEGSDTPVIDNYTSIYPNTSVVIERVPNYMQVGYKEAMETFDAAQKEREDETKKRVQESIPQLALTGAQTAKIPPANYICFRCGQKGHYIQNCPTNNNRQFDVPRIKKATGIPKAFLKPAEDSTSSVLLNEEGKFVRAEPQTREFSKHFRKPGQRMSIPKEFLCGSCREAMVTAVRLGCGHSVCDECVRQRCPVCRERVTRVTEDIPLRRRIETFLERGT